HQEVLAAERLTGLSRAACRRCHSLSIRTFCKEISHGPRKAWCHVARQTQKGSESRQGLLRTSQEYDSYREAGCREGEPIRLPRPQTAQAHFPRALDPASERSSPAVRTKLQQIHCRTDEGRIDHRSQGAVGSRHPRTGSVSSDRGKGQSCVAGVNLFGVMAG